VVREALAQAAWWEKIELSTDQKHAAAPEYLVVIDMEPDVLGACEQESASY
jgi:hypothetical protein